MFVRTVSGQRVRVRRRAAITGVIVVATAIVACAKQEASSRAFETASTMLPASSIPHSALSALPASSSTPPPWVGKYSFIESCGRNVAGTGVVVEHALTLRADGTGELDADGYQTMLRIPATTVGGPDRLEVRFGGEAPTDMFGRDVLPGELLLVLRQSGSSIVTDWKGYPSMCTTARTGKTFQRTND